MIEVRGYTAAGIACGIKPSGNPDLALVVSDRPAAAAAVFTSNRFPGAPVVVSRAHLRGGRARGIVVNSGISNVANGARGLRDAREMAALLAREIGARPREIQVASTGVIGQPLPMEKIREGIPLAARGGAEATARAARRLARRRAGCPADRHAGGPEGRAQRPVPVRLGQEVQEVSRDRRLSLVLAGALPRDIGPRADVGAKPGHPPYARLRLAARFASLRLLT